MSIFDGPSVGVANAERAGASGSAGHPAGSTYPHQAPGPGAAIRTTRLRGKKLRRWLSRAAGATALAASLSSSALPVHAALGAAGAVNVATGLPSWFQDANALRLAPCSDAALCFPGSTPPDPTKPLAFPNNFPAGGETFYWIAEATMPTNNGGVAFMRLATEGGFLPTVAAGNQVAFNRIRFRIDNLVPGATYTVTHPYGVDTFVATSAGTRGINQTIDAGCVTAPCADFAAATTGRIGPWLTWDPAVSPAPPAGFVGSFALPHSVTGSPFGTNFFRVEGPNVGGPGVNAIQTDQFNVAGQIFGPPVVASPLGGVFKAAQAVTLSSSDPAATIFYTTNGTTPTTASTRFRVGDPAIAITSTTTLKYFATGAGGGQSAVQTQTYTIDTLAPTVSLSVPAAGALTKNPAVTLAASAADTGGSGLAGVQFQSNNGTGWINLGAAIAAGPATVAAPGFTLSLTNLADGAYTVRAVATDLAGNSTTSAPVSFVVDTAAPTVGVSAPATNSLAKTRSVTLAASAADAGGSGVASVQFQLSGDDGASWKDAGAALTATPYSLTTSVAADGAYLAHAVAKDLAGNTATSAAVAFKVDTTAPSAAITTPEDNGYVKTARLALAASAADGVAGVDRVTFQLSADGGLTWSDAGTGTLDQATGAYTLTLSAAQAQGAYQARAMVTDKAGNTTTSPPTRFVIDTVAPAVSLTAPAAGLVSNAHAIALAASAADTAGGSGVASVGFEVSADGGVTWNAVDGPAITAEPYAASVELDAGKYLVRAVAQDKAGNLATSPSVKVVQAADDDHPASAGSSSSGGDDDDHPSNSSSSAKDKDDDDDKPSTKKSAPAAKGAAETAGASAASVWRPSGDGRSLSISAPGRSPVSVQIGTTPNTPNEWCSRSNVYLSYIRLQDEGIAGATFGVAGPGQLDWIPPQDAGCVNWSKVDASVNFAKDVIMQFTIVRPQAGALLWVLDGDAALKGRLYEVNADGKAQYVSGAYFAANQDHFKAVWKNVMPVSAKQMIDFQARGLIGPDLGGNGTAAASIPAAAPAPAPAVSAPAASASGAAAQPAPAKQLTVKQAAPKKPAHDDDGDDEDGD